MRNCGSRERGRGGGGGIICRVEVLSERERASAPLSEAPVREIWQSVQKLVGSLRRRRREVTVFTTLEKKILYSYSYW